MPFQRRGAPFFGCVGATSEERRYAAPAAPGGADDALAVARSAVRCQVIMSDTHCVEKCARFMPKCSSIITCSVGLIMCLFWPQVWPFQLSTAFYFSPEQTHRADNRLLYTLFLLNNGARDPRAFLGFSRSALLRYLRPSAALLAFNVNLIIIFFILSTFVRQSLHGLLDEIYV